MDFHTLLYKAQKNNNREKDVRYFKASLDPPKKETKESRQLSEGIKKFLAKKDEEDRQKQLEEQKKKDELLSLRSQDRKSFKRVQSMLNRTKSANKSVIEDAKDDINTSVTMAGFHQPDEDDYGYVSKDAMEIYNKIMNKYVNTPAESRNATINHHRSSDISGAKDRVKAALLKEEEDQLLPHKRKRKAKDLDNGDGHHSDAEPQQQKSKSDHHSEKPKKRPAQPPPLNFQELLKIAEKKQYEPIVIEKPKKKDEDIPMMTKKEREKYLEEKKIEAMRNARRQGKCIPKTEGEIRPVVDKAQKPIPKIASSSRPDIHAEEKLKKHSSVWSKDLKIHKELNNNNNSKSDKYTPRPLNGSESIGNKINSINRATLSKGGFSEKHYSQNEKKYSSNEDPYLPKPKSNTDKYIPKAKNPAQDNYLPKPRSIPNNNDEYVPKSSSSSVEKYSPKSKSVSSKNDGYVSTSNSPSIEKYTPKPKNSMPQDKYLSKSSISTEKYVPKTKISNDEKYSPRTKLSNDEKYSPRTKLSNDEKYLPRTKLSNGEKCSPKPKSADHTDRYVPKAKSTPYAEYTPTTVKRSHEKYSPKPTTSHSKPIGSKDKYIPSPVDKSRKLPPSNNNMKPKQFPPKDLTPKQFPPRDMVRKQFPPKDMVPKQFPPRDLAPRQFPPPDMRRRDDRNMPMRNKRQVIESDSDEYDSDLADFIDDGPEDEEDYSKVISEIFKYDKSKYREIDDDDECMESDFHTLQKEEYRSSRAGLLEDLADIRREKAMMKKRRKV